MRGGRRREGKWGKEVGRGEGFRGLEGEGKRKESVGGEVGEREAAPIPEGLTALVWPGSVTTASLSSFHPPCWSPVFPNAKDTHPVPSPVQVPRRRRQKDQGNSRSPDNTLEPITSMEMKSTYLLT